MITIDEMAGKKPVSLKKLGIKKVPKGYEVTMSAVDFFEKVMSSKKEITLLKSIFTESNKALTNAVYEAEVYDEDFYELYEMDYYLDLSLIETKMSFIDRQNETNWKENYNDIWDALEEDEIYSDLINVILNAFARSSKKDILRQSKDIVFEELFNDLATYFRDSRNYGVEPTMEVENENDSFYNWKFIITFEGSTAREEAINFVTQKKIEDPLVYNLSDIISSVTQAIDLNGTFHSNVFKYTQNALKKWSTDIPVHKDQLSLFENVDFDAVDIEEFYSWRELNKYYGSIPLVDWFAYYKSDSEIRSIDMLFEDIVNEGLRKQRTVTGINDYFYQITATMAKKLKLDKF